MLLDPVEFLNTDRLSSGEMPLRMPSHGLPDEQEDSESSLVSDAKDVCPLLHVAGK